MSQRVLILHGGGPTAVMNASLYGAITAARSAGATVLGAIGGTGGLLQGRVREVTAEPEERLRLLLQTPGSAIGTSRDHLEPAEYCRMAEILGQLEIGCVLCNGGNGTMDMCGRLEAALRAAGSKAGVIGIPKTMDNDLAVTDHSPGYPSAARYIAQSVRELCADVRGLPIHVVVLEALGRNAGWVTAAAALAKGGGCDGPDLIYLPERPFEEAAFLRDTERLIQQKGGVVVVASEGLHYADGTPIVDPVFEVDRSVYYGDVSAHLANLVIQKLGYKARGEKPGILGRASVAMQSPVDVVEARLAGEFAARAALAGESGKMVALRRVSTAPYKVEPFLADIREVMLAERLLPDEFINQAGNGVTNAFVEWCAPLIGPALPDMIAFN